MASGTALHVLCALAWSLREGMESWPLGAAQGWVGANTKKPGIKPSLSASCSTQLGLSFLLSKGEKNMPGRTIQIKHLLDLAQ